MNAPNSSSNALSIRETTGLVEGKGVSAEDTIKDDCVACSSGLMCRSPSIGFKNCKKASDKCCSCLAMSRCLGNIAARGAHGDTRHSGQALPWLQERESIRRFEVSLIPQSDCGPVQGAGRGR